MHALGKHMQAHAADMFLGPELLFGVHLLTLYLQLQQPHIVQAHTVALAEVVGHHPGQLREHGNHRAARGTCPAAHLLHNSRRPHLVLMHRHRLPATVVLQRRAVLPDHSVLHIFFLSFNCLFCFLTQIARITRMGGSFRPLISQIPQIFLLFFLFHRLL